MKQIQFLWIVCWMVLMIDDAHGSQVKLVAAQKAVKSQSSKLGKKTDPLAVKSEKKIDPITKHSQTDAQGNKTEWINDPVTNKPIFSKTTLKDGTIVERFMDSVTGKNTGGFITYPDGQKFQLHFNAAGQQKEKTVVPSATKSDGIDLATSTKKAIKSKATKVEDANREGINLQAALKEVKPEPINNLKTEIDYGKDPFEHNTAMQFEDSIWEDKIPKLRKKTEAETSNQQKEQDSLAAMKVNNQLHQEQPIDHNVKLMSSSTNNYTGAKYDTYSDGSRMSRLKDGTVRIDYTNDNFIEFKDGQMRKYDANSRSTRVIDARKYEQQAKLITSLAEVQKLIDKIEQDANMPISKADKKIAVKQAKSWFPLFDSRQFTSWFKNVVQKIMRSKPKAEVPVKYPMYTKTEGIALSKKQQSLSKMAQEQPVLENDRMYNWLHSPTGSIISDKAASVA